MAALLCEWLNVKPIVKCSIELMAEIKWVNNIYLIVDTLAYWKEKQRSSLFMYLHIYVCVYMCVSKLHD